MFAKVSILCVIAGALVLAACGGSSNDKGANQTQKATPGGNGSQEIGKEEFGMTEERLVTTIDEVEAAIATCMDAAGFEYVPIDAVTFRDAMVSLTSVPGLSDEEFVAQYGYGYSTRPPTQKFGAGEENKRIVDALSPQDQVAYKRELWGENTDATFVVMLENEDFSGAGGCTKTAIEKVFTPEQLSPTFQNPFDVLVEQDPRRVDAVKKWSECMKKGGYDYEDPQDGEDEILERYDDLTKGADPTTLSESDQAALKDLQDQERALALADFACQDEFLAPVEQHIEHEISGRN